MVIYQGLLCFRIVEIMVIDTFNKNGYLKMTDNWPKIIPKNRKNKTFAQCHIHKKSL